MNTTAELFPFEPIESAGPTPVAIYEAYPRRQATADAVRAIAKAIKQKRVTAEALLAAVQEYASYIEQWPKADRQYVPLCASWVNADRWEDDRSYWKPKPSRSSAGFA